MDLPDQSSPEQSANRRVADRRALRTSAHIELPGGQYVEVRTVDISSTGIAFIASANPRNGTSFSLSFAVPEKPKGQILCEVRVKVVNSVYSAREGGFRIGVLFTNLDPVAATAIKEFVG
jgi:c-di-GMP-binding flagellar brake protein YcgR